ncbi:DNA cytosine methyltransferase [Pseudomonas sp. Ga0074129]|uniref:DNA cytosine methyltransferase n=1 Tax=Pseudomonas sp. Ga0074129 TaxID=1752219 RepID=UPI000AA4F39C|nr:DNA cytosine methyltransferase [Pseudomonas sp. Ga0074129]
MTNLYRIHPQPSFNFGGLVIDNFAGGGGASTGIELGLGRPVDIAINHAPDAVAMHTTNHPHTRHFCESVWEVNPRDIVGTQPVELCWFSPDCKHFSKAKGNVPVSKEIRGLAWVALRYAATVRPRVIMLENVEEFVTWGPINVDGRPCPKNKGRTFTTFVNALRRQGYQVEWKELRGCDYGAATIRKRLFMICRRDGQPITWPAPTHGDPASPAVKSGQLKPWRTAGDIIDWSIPCPSIFTRKKPLADKTLARIARGLKRFVIDARTPYIVNNKAGFITEHANGSSQRNMPASEPLRTICAEVKGGHFALVTAFLAKHYGGNYTGPGSSLTDPLSTVTTVDHNALVTAHIQRDFGTSTGHAMDRPLGTITADGGGGKSALVQAFLIKYYGQGEGQTLADPLHTITTVDRMGLVMVRGEPWRIVDIGMRMLEPHELFAAQGFPADYIHNRLADGTPLSKKAQVRMVGNSVCPPVAAALVRANLVDQQTGEVAA